MSAHDSDEQITSAPWVRACAAAGIQVLDLIEESRDSVTGDGSATVRWGAVGLHFVRDRGQDFLEIGPASEPNVSFPIEDVRAAFAWGVAAGDDASPVPLTRALTEIAQHKAFLEHAFSRSQVASSCSALTQAQAKRRALFLAKLKNLADASGGKPDEDGEG